MPKPQLSLCMIVRDEEKMLPQFLQHAEGLWDELCVVDTGSVDRSIDILRAAGAKLQQRPWRDDFAEARNASLQMASGDWILFLDADELVSPEVVRQIRGLLSDPQAGAAKIVMRNRMPQGHLHDTPLLRLFRNDPSIGFRCRIHEEVTTSVKAYLERTGTRLVLLDGIVEHLGYQRSVALEKDKKERDRKLLEACLQEDPEDLYSHFKLLELAKVWQDQTLLRRAAQQVKQQIEALGPKVLQRFADAGELISLIAEGIAPDNPQQRLAFLQAWPHETCASYLLCRAEALELLGRLELAGQDFRSCLTLDHDQMQQRIAIRPRMGLARLAMATGDLPQAIEFTEAALAQNPRDLEALLAAVGLYRALGEEALQQFIGKYRKRYGALSELDRAIGEEAFLRADFPLAAAKLTAAAAAEPDDLPLQRICAQALLADGSPEQAQQHCRQFLQPLPELAAGLIVCGLILQQDLDFTVDIELEPLSIALREWLALLGRSPHPQLLEAFWQTAPAVYHLFPWLENEQLSPA